MKILVDTSIWSYAFRANKPEFKSHVDTLIEIISNNNIIIIGAIKQEILSGYSDIKQFQKLEKKMIAFENSTIRDDDYIQAAKFSNQCRINGVQGSPVDFLICAVAYRLEVKIYTTDKDFFHYQKYIPIELL